MSKMPELECWRFGRNVMTNETFAEEPLGRDWLKLHEALTAALEEIERLTAANELDYDQAYINSEQENIRLRKAIKEIADGKFETLDFAMWYARQIVEDK